MGKKYQVLITTVSFMLFSFLLNAQKSPVACNGQLKIEGSKLKVGSRNGTMLRSEVLEV